MKNKHEPVLHLEDLYKAFGPKVVLDNVDLKVSSGEFVSVIGPSGCGKSTLLKLILGDELPTEGIMKIDGKDIGFPDEDRGIVYQKYTLLPNLTVLQNISLGEVLKAGILGQHINHKAIEEKAMEYLNMVKLIEHANKYSYELSGGMQQRVAIAQAMIMKPKILLMDEPFGALDPGTRESLQTSLLEVWKKNQMTVFFVTHDLPEAIFLGSRLIVLSQFYTDGRGDGPNVKRGARIVADYNLGRQVYSTKVKMDPAFNQLKEDVKEFFKPENRRNVQEFNLQHPDSFQTLRTEEAGQ